MVSSRTIVLAIAPRVGAREARSVKRIAALLLTAHTVSVGAGSQAPSAVDKLVGKFFRADGVSLEIKSGGRFTYVMDTDVGNVERADGTVEVIDGRLWFWPSSESRLQPNSRLTGWWVPVAWGERQYLIEEQQLLPFANDVNLGTEPRKSLTGSYLLRRGDVDRPVTGWPDVPAEWRGYLLHQPIGGVITKVTDDRHAEIDVGRRNGLRAQMVLMAARRSGGWLDVTVTSVTPNSSRVSGDPGESPLFVGQRVTSRP